MINSVIPWMGGKFNARKKIINFFPEHQCYVEVFGGAGHVLFGKEPSKREVYNDLDGELVNLFRVIQDKPQELLASFRWTTNSRQEFQDMKTADTSKLSNVLRARRWIYILKNAFGANHPEKATFGTAKGKRSLGVNLETILKTIERAHWRLLGVTIESLDFEKLLSVYDAKGTLFFLDPPYWKTKYYKYNFQLSDWKRLVNALRKLKGQFFMTVSGDKEMLEFFKGFEIKEVPVRYTVMKEVDKSKEFKEIWVSNYPLK